jgi:hypothetical protein
MRAVRMQNPFMTVGVLPDKGAGIFATIRRMDFVWGGAPFLGEQLRLQN